MVTNKIIGSDEPTIDDIIYGLSAIGKNDITEKVVSFNFVPEEIENLDELKTKFTEPYVAAQSKKEKKFVIDKYRKEAARILNTNYDWPKYISRKVANLSKPASSADTGKKWTDYGIAAVVGFLPLRYVKPLSKLMKVNREFITEVSVYADWASTALTYGIAILVPEVQDALHKIPVVSVITSVLGDGASYLLYGNIVAKGIQLPIRTYRHFKMKRHTPGPAAIINPNLLEMVVSGALFGYDWYKSFRHRITDNGNGKNKQNNKVYSGK